MAYLPVNARSEPVAPRPVNPFEAGEFERSLMFHAASPASPTAAPGLSPTRGSGEPTGAFAGYTNRGELASDTSPLTVPLATAPAGVMPAMSDAVDEPPPDVAHAATISVSVPSTAVVIEWEDNRECFMSSCGVREGSRSQFGTVSSINCIL